MNFIIYIPPVKPEGQAHGCILRRSMVNNPLGNYSPVITARLVSGDSSVVTRWTVDQEVVGSNPTHGGNLISVVRSLSGFTQPIR